MKFESWAFTAMEEYGYTDTADGLISRLAIALQRMYPDGGNIGYKEFVSACMKCGIDPYSFTQKDMAKLNRRLNLF